MAVRSTQDRNRAARSAHARGCHPYGNGLWYMYYLYLGFQIKYIVTKVKKTHNFLLKTFILQNINASPFYTDLGLPCTLLSCEC